MSTPRRTRRRALRPHRSLWGGAAVLAALAAALTGCGGSDGPKLALTAALPNKVPAGTVIRIGDPSVQSVLKASGLDKQLDAAGVKVKWADISGGPESIQAFRGNKLDCSSVADIPSLFAAWTGTPTKIVFQSVTVDPLRHPTYQLGVAPGQKVSSLADLKGKKIAYSPGQAQGALVLRVLKKAGLSQSDVKLVEMTSTNDTFATALGTKSVDVAPLGQSLVKTYEQKYAGGSAINTGIRDDAATVYCLTSSLKDANKAAALKVYVGIRAKALLWENQHPADYARLYYQGNQGLSAADATATVAQLGQKGIPASWSGAVQRLQETADVLATAQNHKKLDVNDLVDRRFEAVETAAAGANVVHGAAQ